MNQEIIAKYDFYLINNQDSNLKEVANVVTSAFKGIQSGTQFIQEPMLGLDGNISFEGLSDFIHSFLKETATQNLSFAAVSKETGKVVGAIIAEDFHTDLKLVLEEGSYDFLNPLNKALFEIDIRFLDFLKETHIPDLKDGDISHAFLIGLVEEFDKKYIAYELTRLWLEAAKEKGMKVCFVEATNPRSKVLVQKFFGFELPVSKDGKEIQYHYGNGSDNDDYYKFIPKELSETCDILYKMI